MRLKFTTVFELYTQKNEYYLINKKLDTIIQINESLYKVLSNVEQGIDIDHDEVNLEVLNILLYNRVLEAIN